MYLHTKFGVSSNGSLLASSNRKLNKEVVFYSVVTLQCTENSIKLHHFRGHTAQNVIILHQTELAPLPPEKFTVWRVG
jgi:hypothetical protein